LHLLELATINPNAEFELKVVDRYVTLIKNDMDLFDYRFRKVKKYTD
jgi:hypothetical protein